MASRKPIKHLGFLAWIEIRSMLFARKHPIPDNWGLEGDTSGGWASLWLAAAHMASPELFLNQDQIRPVRCAYHRKGREQPEEVAADLRDIRRLQEMDRDYARLLQAYPFSPDRTTVYGHEMAVYHIRCGVEFDVAKSVAREETIKKYPKGPEEQRPELPKVQRVDAFLRDGGEWRDPESGVEKPAVGKHYDYDLSKIMRWLRDEDQELDAHRERVGVKLCGLWIGQ